MGKLEAQDITPKGERPLKICHRDPGVIGREDAKRLNTHYLVTAITLSSIAMGVGNAPTSTVVLVGFGFPGPAKYSG